MAVREILIYPDERLKQISAEISDFDESLKEAVQDLIDTLEASPGCVGIAAPQIAHQIRVLLIDASRNRKTVPNQGRILMINPLILSASGALIGREGCLSLPHLTANVTRATEIELAYRDLAGNEHRIKSMDFEARVIQHELDHLDGLLFLDRVSSLKTDVFRRKRY